MYYEDMIYSYIGNVVISMNPFKDLPIYDDLTISKYRGRSAFDPKLPPHIFALADNVFSDMKWRGRDQVVIISGESGAGKTEAAKKIMQYVAAVSGSSEKVNKIKDKLLLTNPLLESFGNAKTTRNNNSSRFGKYMDIQFDFKGDPSGGVITTYLLEKARVIHLGEGERNFHIFYQLLAGQADKQGLRNEASAFELLCHGEPKVKGLDDRKWYADVNKGLNAIGFSADEQNQLWQGLACVLLLGNLSFVSDGKTGSKLGVTKKAQQAAAAEKIETLIGVSSAQISHALTHNTRIVNGSKVAGDLDPEQSAASRDTLCKALYQRLFNWMCERINQSISVDATQIKAVIGVLDIYGFEVFKTNSFEQFCINYCNEKLQQLFIELTLKTEQDEYTAEGIEWTPIKYFNNKIICDLVDKKRGGIIATLDEESIRPGETTDKVWLNNMTTAIGNHAHFVVRKNPQDKSIPENSFILKHYAGDVVYSVDGFLEKNKDTMYKDLSKLMFESNSSVLKSCFPEGDETTWKSAGKRPTTAGRLFANSMDAMIKLLNSKTPSYVRCIKPNHTRSVHKIEPELMQHQVQYLGLVENVRVRRAGYCFRETYKEFLWRYRILSDQTYPNWNGSDKDGCIKVFEALGVRSNMYQLGKTKLFIKHPKLVFRIEEERDDKLDEIATKLQLGWRLALVNRTVFGWFDGIRDMFQPVLGLDGRSPTYGFSPSKVNWPGHKPQLKTSSDFLKGVYGSWWAKKMVGPLPAQQQTLMRDQFVAHDIFAGQKAKFSIKAAGLDVTDHTREVDPSGDKKAVFESKHGKVLWCAEADKISKGGKGSKRLIVLTDTALFRTNNWKVQPSRTLEYNQIKGVTTSPEADSVIVLHTTEEGSDILLNFASADEVNRAFGFVSKLKSVAKAAGVALKMEVLDSQHPLVYNNSGKPGKEHNKMVKFMKDPAEIPGTRWQQKSKTFVYF